MERGSCSVIDTNVLMSDPDVLRSLGQTTVLLPLEVLHELDKLKSPRSRDDDVPSRQARDALRALKKLKRQGSLERGVTLTSGETVQWMTYDESDLAIVRSMLKAHVSNESDLRILATAYHARRLYESVVLLTNDFGVELAADLLRIKGEEWKVSRSDVYSGHREITGSDSAKQTIFEALSKGTASTVIKQPKPSMSPHETVSVTVGDETALGVVSADCAQILPLNPEALSSIMGITAKNREQQLALHLLLDPAIPVVTITGTAGTGKTLLTLSAGLHQVVQGRYAEVIVTRALEPIGKDPGSVPGDVTKKISPYMDCFEDNLAVIREMVLSGRDLMNHYPSLQGRGRQSQRSKGQLNDMSAHSVPSSLVEVRKEPITYLRGRSIRAAFIVVDEAQNLTRKMIKTIITRAGEGSKVVLLGDLEQIDSSHGGLSPNANGLAVTIERFRTQELSGHITLKEGMRSPLASMAALLL